MLTTAAILTSSAKALHLRSGAPIRWLASVPVTSRQPNRSRLSLTAILMQRSVSLRLFTRLPSQQRVTHTSQWSLAARWLIGKTASCISTVRRSHCRLSPMAWQVSLVFRKKTLCSLTKRQAADSVSVPAQTAFPVWRSLRKCRRRLTVPS